MLARWMTSRQTQTTPPTRHRSTRTMSKLSRTPQRNATNTGAVSRKRQFVATAEMNVIKLQTSSGRSYDVPPGPRRVRDEEVASYLDSLDFAPLVKRLLSDTQRW